MALPLSSGADLGLWGTGTGEFENCAFLWKKVLVTPLQICGRDKSLLFAVFEA